MGHLTEVEEKALRHFVEKLKERFGADYCESFLFGSKARGDFHGESDVDVAVILKEVSSAARRDVIDLSYDELLDHEVDISPLILSDGELRRFQEEGFPIGREMTRDRIPL